MRKARQRRLTTSLQLVVSSNYQQGCQRVLEYFISREATFSLATETMTISNDSQETILAHATNGLAEKLGIEILELTASRVVATMPVDERTRQPYGLLHGGASVALAETLASLGAIMNIDQQHSSAVGLEINANHIRAKREGTVRGTATPSHIGRSTHVWMVEIVDEEERIVCVARCTIAIVPTR